MRRNYPQVGMVPASAEDHIRPIDTIAMKAHARPVPSGMFAAIFFTLLFILSVVASRAQGRLILTGKVLSAEAIACIHWDPNSREVHTARPRCQLRREGCGTSCGLSLQASQWMQG